MQEQCKLLHVQKALLFSVFFASSYLIHYSELVHLCLLFVLSFSFISFLLSRIFSSLPTCSHFTCLSSFLTFSIVFCYFVVSLAHRFHLPVRECLSESVRSHEQTCKLDGQNNLWQTSNREDSVWLIQITSYYVPIGIKMWMPNDDTYWGRLDIFY